MARYTVRLRRKGPEQFCTITVDADSEEKARARANNLASGRLKPTDSDDVGAWVGEGTTGKNVVISVERK